MRRSKSGVEGRMPTTRAGVEARRSGNGDAYVSALSARVDILQDEVRALNNRFDSGFSKIEAKLDAIVQGTAERNRTQWGTLIAGGTFLLAIIAYFGSAKLEPITAAILEIKTTQLEDRKELSKTIKEITNSIVPRGEHEQRWNANQAAMDNVQRQIDDMNKTYGSTYSLKDAMSDITKRIDKLEHPPIH